MAALLSSPQTDRGWQVVNKISAVGIIDTECLKMAFKIWDKPKIIRKKINSHVYCKLELFIVFVLTANTSKQ